MTFFSLQTIQCLIIDGFCHTNDRLNDNNKKAANRQSGIQIEKTESCTSDKVKELL
jgi:hypothetical protein